MNLKLLMLKVFSIICVASAKLNQISTSTSLIDTNDTVNQFNNTLDYNDKDYDDDDLITLTNTQQEAVIEKPFTILPAKPFKYWTVATNQKPSSVAATTAKYDNAVEEQQQYLNNHHPQQERQQQQQQQILYKALKFNNENYNLNKLKTFTKEIADDDGGNGDAVDTDVVATNTNVMTTKIATAKAIFNDNEQLKDFQNDDDDYVIEDYDDDDVAVVDVVVVDNIKENDDNLQQPQQAQQQHQTTNLYTSNSFSNAFVGQLPQFQQHQQQHEQPLLPQEYHHLSDYRLLFNPERHTEFYLHTISLPAAIENEYGIATAAAAATGREFPSIVNNNNDESNNNDAATATTATAHYDIDNENDDDDDETLIRTRTMMSSSRTNVTNPRVLNVVTDTIGAAFGVNTRPVAAIHGIRIEEIELYNGLSLRQSRFNPFNPCRILIHGWLGGSNAAMYNTLVPEYLKLQQGSYNIFTVNWGKGATADYITASYRVKPVGKVVAKFIDFLHQESGIPFENIQVIGFSMGAHVAGIAGKHLQHGRLPVIYALDPALPLFRYENVNERIDRTDADYVEVIHTSSGSYGYDRPLGHVDFYINFGNNQPGCYLYECSHFRAFQIFAQSLRNEVMTGRECSEEMWLDMIKNKRCLSLTGMQLSMAVETLNGSMMSLRRGLYYVMTNAQPPFRVTEVIRM